MKINIIGSFFGIDGYSNHTKQLANTLNKLEDVEITLTVDKPQGWERLINDDELQMLLGKPDECDINLMIGTPSFWPLYMNQNKPFIGFCVWEGDKIPEGWIKNMSHPNCKQIWVPSEHTENAILNIFGLDQETKNQDSFCNKIKIVPHGVNPNIFNSKNKPDDKFRVLCNKGFRGELDRGGIQFLIRAFMEEFNENDNIELIVKVNPAYGVGMTQQIINQYSKSIGEKKYPKIALVEDNMKYEDLNNLYNSANLFVSPTMAEAFNLPCIEAQACGLAVVTSDFGGQTDFCNDKTGWILKEGGMFEVQHEVQYEGISWKKQSIPELRKVLRYCYNNQDEVKSKGLKALENSKQWSWDESAKKAHLFLKEIIKK